MKEEYINAFCVVFPSGETLWLESEKGRDAVLRLVAEWKEQHPEYSNKSCTMGVVEIVMPIENFKMVKKLELIE